MAESTYGEGIACPECAAAQSGVLDSRPRTDNSSIKRRRTCANGHRFTTVEIVVPEGPVVIRPGAGQRPPTVTALADYLAQVGASAARHIATWST